MSIKFSISTNHDISISDGVARIKLYDKRDGFPFSIVRLSYKESNMPSFIFYSTIGAEMLRISRACTFVDDFMLSTKSLLKRMYTQGAKHFLVLNIIKKTFGRHIFDFKHISQNSNDLVTLLLSES